MANWSELSEDIVGEILKRFTLVEDFVRSGVVCKPWGSVVAEKKQQQVFAPLAMHAERENDSSEGGRCFFNPSLGNKKFWHELPEAQGRRCWGTPYGWLVTVGLDLEIHLLNPLSRIQIPLPSQPNLQSQSTIEPIAGFEGPDAPICVLQGYLYKFALASDLSLVVAIFGGTRELALALPGAASWTPIECPPTGKANKDVIFFDGKIYIVSGTGMLRVCEINTKHPKAVDIANPPDFALPNSRFYCDKFYLVQVSGDLLLVARRCFECGYSEDVHPDQFHYETRGFAVFKFDFHMNKWSEQIRDFGDYALLVGNNESFAISTSIYSEFKSNCIYFTDDHSTIYYNNFCDMGVFDLKQENFTFQDFGGDAFSEISRPLFFRPTV